MNGEEFPKVLIVCPVPLNDHTGGGVAMSGFFRGWPKDRIAQIYTIYNVEPNYSICGHYYLASNILRFSAKLFFPPIANLDSTFRAVRASRTAFQDGPNPDLDETVDFAQKFDPDVIYCQPIQSPKSSWWLPRYLGAVLDRPIVTHVMDDWPNMIENTNRAAGRIHWVDKLHASVQDLFDNSAARLGISDSMDRDYRRRYGHSFEVVQNSIQNAEWANVHKQYGPHDGPFKIMYVGKILPFMQKDSLKDIGEVASRMTKKGKPVDLVIYGPEHLTGKYGKDIFAQSAVQYGGFLPRKDFVDALIGADLLVVPVNFDEKSLSFVQHSMPAKVPEYMASSTPVLVYAPKATPPAEYAAKSGWGVVVNERNLELLEERITELLETPSLSQELGQKARSIALENHSFESTRARFRQILREAAATRSPSLIRDVADVLIMTRTRFGFRRLVGRLPAGVKALLRGKPRRPEEETTKKNDGTAQLERELQQKVTREVAQELGSSLVPIIVYHMGQVGSYEVYEPLKKGATQPVYQINYMLADPTKIPMIMNHRVGRGLFEVVAHRRREAKYITLVSDPIGRNVSAFFEPKLRGTDQNDDRVVVDELVDQFINQYDHDTPIKWFDVEMRRSLGIDVYQNPFDTERGYSVITAGNSEVLILKTELSDHEKSKIIAEFVAIPDFQVKSAESGERSYFRTAVLPGLRLPQSYVDRMLSAKFTQHFYGEQEIAELRHRWVGQDHAAHWSD